MAMTIAGKGGGGFDVERALDFEKRSSAKDGDIETFITKVDAVNAAIQAMKDGTVDPADVHVDGVPTVEEERQMEELRRKKRLELAKRDQENRARQNKEENDKWWRGAELLYGDRERRSRAEALNESVTRGCSGSGGSESGNLRDSSCSTRYLSEEERQQLKDRYSMEYSRWDKWIPKDPATLAEVEEREEEEDQKRTKEFEESNPDFCKTMVDDMKARSEASEKKDSAATTARLKGNRFYKAKRWEKALDLYMTSLKARPYAVNTLANIAQTLLKLERWQDAMEFCDRALHVDGKCIKALSRRATAFVKLAGECSSNSFASVNATKATTTATTTTAGVPGCHEVDRSDGKAGALANDTLTTTVETSVLTTTAKDSGTISGSGNCRGVIKPGGGAGEDTFDACVGGRKELMALALQDLDTAVEVDADGEDIRRQRDNLKKEIDEEKAEAGVMNRVRKRPGNFHARPLSADDLSMPGREDPSVPRVNKPIDDRVVSPPRQGSSGTVADRVDQASPAFSAAPPPGDRVAADEQDCPCEREPGEVELDLREIDFLLQEALANGGKASRMSTSKSSGVEHVETENDIGAGAPAKHIALVRLSSILDDSPTARVYFRASGGLGRLAGATVTFSNAVIADRSDAGHSGASRSFEKDKKLSVAEIGLASTAAVAGGIDRASSDAFNNHLEEDSNGSGCAKTKRTDVIEGRVGDLVRFGSMLRAVSVALKGGERLAQQEVFSSGLLGDPCARAIQVMYEGDQEGMAAAVAAAGAAALLLSRVVEDVSVRTHVAKSTHLLSGLVGLIHDGSTPPPDVQAAASALRALLIGRTASVAAKTLTEAAATTSDVSTLTGQTEGKIAGWPATAVGEALLAWRDGGGPMQGAPTCTGSALCSVLANLAMNEQFRGSFAEPFLLRSAGSGGRVSTTVAAVLVLVAGDTKADRSEARTVALAALVNACLHNRRAQSATLSAGGLALAVATLSLEGEDRTRYAPPLVAARSAGLLARLCPLPGALEAMTRPGVLDRLVEATVRSSTLGGDLYTPAVPAPNKEDATVDAATSSAAETAAYAIERENLVRTLGSILRPKPTPTPPAAGDSKHMPPPPAPSSNVPAPGVVVTKDAKAYLVATAETAKLAAALVSFLPPAREDGAQGVTAASAPMRPEWRAPPAVTANVCVCLLHLLDGERCGIIADQVVGAGGIPRLISLFANSGGEGGALSARTNAAICLAKLARKPGHKQMIAELRGMEMLVQAGTGLATQHGKTT